MGILNIWLHKFDHLHEWIQQCPSSVFCKDKCNQNKLPEVKDAENIASDLYVGKAAKGATMHNPDVFMVAIGWRLLNFRCRLSILENLRKSSTTFGWVFVKVIRIWPEFTCLWVLEIIFENTETRKVKTKIMRAWLGPCWNLVPVVVVVVCVCICASGWAHVVVLLHHW